MSRAINPKQLEAWIEKLQINLRKFLEDSDKTQEEKLAFIRRQYELLDIINKVLLGKIYFSGCSQSTVKKVAK